MADPADDVAGVITYPPLIYVAGLAVGGLLHKLMPIRFLPAKYARFIGGTLVGLSFVPGGWAATVMRRANTNLDPHRPTTTIVTDGPFAYTRNPIYLSFTMLFAGIAATFNSLTMLLPLPVVLAVLQRGVIEREERYLERKFGAEYTQYKARVRRWL